jgi:hypothetical protein
MIVASAGTAATSPGKCGDGLRSYCDRVAHPKRQSNDAGRQGDVGRSCEDLNCLIPAHRGANGIAVRAALDPRSRRWHSLEAHRRNSIVRHN